MDHVTAFCADIGSVAKGNFGWFGLDVRGQELGGDDIRELVTSVAERLGASEPVCLGFECPLFLPVDEDPAKLTSARIGDTVSFFTLMRR